MASYTAQILIGHAHPHHGGINPTHALFVSENDRPALVLHTLDPHPLASSTPRTWIPTVEHMMEDALLMAYALVVQEPTIRQAAEARFRKSLEDRLEFHEDILEEELIHLHSLCRDLECQAKCVISVLEGSTVQGQLEVLGHYRCAMEVCSSSFQREHTGPDHQLKDTGALPARGPSA